MKAIVDDPFAPPRLAAALAKRSRFELSRLVAPKRAAVAITLRPSDVGQQVLLMKRVERKGDRWSGQISLPGGKAEPMDASLLHTALREMGEEVGLWLSADRLIGPSDDQMAMAKGKVLPMAITPYVLRAQVDDPELDLGPEAQEAFWLPLSALISGDFDGTYRWRHGPISRELPCWRWKGQVIWGLTYVMLSKLLEIGTSPELPRS